MTADTAPPRHDLFAPTTASDTSTARSAEDSRRLSPTQKTGIPPVTILSRYDQISFLETSDKPLLISRGKCGME